MDHVERIELIAEEVGLEPEEVQLIVAREGYHEVTADLVDDMIAMIRDNQYL